MTIDDYVVKDDVKVICFEATSFPDGVQESYRTLNKILPESRFRTLFGISYPGKGGKIVYKAAVEEAFEGEAGKLGRGTFTILKGTYISVYVDDFMSDESRIGAAFHELLADPRIDRNGCCVEMYVGGKDVRCMVRLDPMKVRRKKEKV